MNNENDKLINVDVNPLKHHELGYTQFQPISIIDQTPENLLKIMVSKNVESDFESIKARYQELSPQHEIFGAPLHKKFLDRIVYPLRDSKSCFMAGNYFGTIAICGMVTEMITQLMFDCWDYSLKEKSMPKNQQQKHFGEPFDKMKQYRKIEVLQVIGLLDDSNSVPFQSIRKIRNKYMHTFTSDWTIIKEDAVNIYSHTCKALKVLTKEQIKDGKIYFDLHFLDYIVKEMES